MQLISDTHIYVGKKADIYNLNNDWVIVHACKTSHKEKLGKVTSASPYYIIYEEDNEIFINWVDAPEPRFFDWANQGVANFMKIMDFIDNKKQNKQVLIHCDQGMSRSPALTMLYLAKRTVILPDDSSEAINKFKKLCPNYNSDTGITKFIINNWDKIK